MEYRLLFVIVVFLFLVSGCQQQVEDSSSRISVSDPIIKDENVKILQEDKLKDVIKEKVTVYESDSIYEGMIVVAVGERYKIKLRDSSEMFRFIAEADKFKVFDQIQFKLKKGIVLDVVLLDRQKTSNEVPHKGNVSGDDLANIGEAIILEADYGRYLAKDDETFKRFVFNMPNKVFRLGDRIKYHMNLNGYVINAEKIN